MTEFSDLPSSGDLLQIDDCGFGIQMVEDLIGPRVLDEFRYSAVLIHQVTKGHGVCRTGLDTGRDDLSIPDLSPLVFRSVFALHDPLDAEGTFFHDPFLPNSHVRIELPVQGFGPGEGKPVEATNLVGTVLRTEERADAAVVDLIVEPIHAVMGSKHGADRLAGCIVTVLAEHGDEPDKRFLRLEETFDPDPRHLPSLEDLFFPDKSHIVLGIAGETQAPQPIQRSRSMAMAHR